MRVRLAVLTAAMALLVGAGTVQGQSISGTLTDAVTGLPLGNIPILRPVYGVQVVDANGARRASISCRSAKVRPGS